MRVFAKHRGIPSNHQTERCVRCGGKLPAAQRANRAERPCGCWDPLVEWLMDRSEKRA